MRILERCLLERENWNGRSNAQFDTTIYPHTMGVFSGGKGVNFISDNGWRYGVGLPCRLFYFTTAFDGKLHYTAGYAPFLFRIIINLQLNEK